MKATNLKQVLSVFDPRRPLIGQDLHMWFTPRQGSPRRRLEIDLRESRQPAKILFVGHRGSGKTTELNKLTEEIRDAFQVIGFSVLDLTGRTTPEYEDLMLVISTQVTTECIKAHLISRPLSEPVRKKWEDLRNWWLQVIAGLDFRAPDREGEISLQLSTILGQVEVGARQSSVTHEHIKFQINQQMPELIDRLNWVIDQAEAASNKRMLIVVEGLDKVDLKSAADIFRDHAPTITAPKASMIYSFPLTLRHSEHYQTIRLSFPQVHFLPNIATHHADHSPDPEGDKTLRRLVQVRIDNNLITPEALDVVVNSNGGIPVWLVFLMRSSALYAMERSEEAPQITLADARNAVKELRREMLAPLSQNDLQFLRARHQDRHLTNDADAQRLLYLGSLIEYFNDLQWCDAHPALWSLLEQMDDDNPIPESSTGG